MHLVCFVMHRVRSRFLTHHSLSLLQESTKISGPGFRRPKPKNFFSKTHTDQFVSRSLLISVTHPSHADVHHHVLLKPTKVTPTSELTLLLRYYSLFCWFIREIEIFRFARPPPTSRQDWRPKFLCFSFPGCFKNWTHDRSIKPDLQDESRLLASPVASARPQSHREDSQRTPGRTLFP